MLPETASPSLGGVRRRPGPLSARQSPKRSCQPTSSTARSLMPPGSAAGRDFSSLAPTLPAFLADACTGCMDCVTVCPDTALMRQPSRSQSWPMQRRRTSAASEPIAEAAEVLARFTETSKYGRQAAKRGLEPAKFGIFIDPTKCKGCAECVAVCPADALRMTDKVADAGNGRSTVETAARDSWTSIRVAAADARGVHQRQPADRHDAGGARLPTSAAPARAPAAARGRRCA